MATYFVSDVHGYAKQFFELLDHISLTSDDLVIVGGDLIDRGPGSRELLRWAMYKAPSNMRFLLGNHEDMLASWLVCARKADARNNGSQEALREHPWVYNQRSSADMEWYGKHLHSDEVSRILAWIDTLPCATHIVAGERDFLCVHAGFSPRAWDPNSYVPRQDALLTSGARWSHENLKRHGMGIQGSQNMLWMRDGWYDRTEEDPMHVVCGHTPNVPRHIERLRRTVDAADVPAHIEKYSACHVLTRHLCDGGSGWRSRNPKAQIAMLRLDDLACFGEKAGGPTYPSDAYMDWFERSRP